MKKFFTTLLCAAIAALCLAPQAEAAQMREHRAVWLTPYLGEWPGTGINATNAQRLLNNLDKRLDEMEAGGINIIYYHVRSMCDATYKSSYEPWSKGVSGTRGTEPYFDPLEKLLERAHARGIEVYAWFNPYRYCGKYRFGDSPLDYEVSHPEWLIMQEDECILNPALEEVKQRIVDVIVEVIDNYDVDGIIFDDYFYSNPTPNALDDALYNEAKAADPSVGTKIQWRVNNVNSMIQRVSKAIKEHKPYLPFGISPAGSASPANIRTEYGLEPSPQGDWQYNAIASDPLAWLKNQWIDFIAPQIYWPDKFDIMQDWWNIAARKFGRHLHTAITFSDYSNFGGAEYSREVDYARDLLATGESGISFFRYNVMNDSYIKYDGKSMSFTQYIGLTSYSTQALTPIRPWNNVYAPAYTANVHRDGENLVWDAVEGMRYTVYAFAAGEEQKPFSSNLVQVCYTNSLAIPSDLSGSTFGVAVYDRYGNEYPMLLEGATLGEAVNAELTYPANGEKAADLFDFTWKENGHDNILEVATDADFANIIATCQTNGSAVSSYQIPNLTEGKTYYWRVRTNAVNAAAGVSEVRSFVASRFATTGPNDKNQTTTPTITWTPAYEGSVYKVEISINSQFSTIAYSGETTETSLKVDEGYLNSGRRYYYRVTASRDNRTSTSDVAEFWTADLIPELPKFVNPASDGATLYANQTIELAPVANASGMKLNISNNAEFTGRLFSQTMRDGENYTKALSEIKVAGKNLVAGQTYYVRACSMYFTQDNQTSEKSTDYTVSSFVYSDANGVGDITGDEAEVTVSPEGIVTMPVEGNTVSVYRTDGSCVFTCEGAPTTVDISALAAGLYIVNVVGPTPAAIKWVK